MTMGYHVQIGDPQADLSLAKKIIDHTFIEIDQIYNNWNPDSEISQINQSKAGEKIRLSTKLSAFLKEVESLVLLTEGRFDPTIGPIKSALLHESIPLKKQTIGWQHLSFDGESISKSDATMALDLGGVAKGYAVDLIIERLRDAGYSALYVEWGGEIRTTGLHPKKRPWKIAIRGGEVIELKESAVATSGSYLQKWTINNTEYTHIIDPLLQVPLSNSPITSVSVICETCLKADALATALMLFPSKEEAQLWATAHGIKIWLF